MPHNMTRFYLECIEYALVQRNCGQYLPIGRCCCSFFLDGSYSLQQEAAVGPSRDMQTHCSLFLISYIS